MKNKRSIIGLGSIFLVSSLFLLLSVFCKNNRNMVEDRSDDTYSFYYRDTFFVDRLFPELVDYDVYSSNDNLVKSERRFFFKNPEWITIDDINIHLLFKNEYDSLTRPVKVRCWKNDCFHVEETTSFPLLSSSKLFHLYDEVLRRFWGYNSVTSSGDSLFLFNRGKVSLITPQRKDKLGSMIINDPIYIQLLRGGDYIFF